MTFEQFQATRRWADDMQSALTGDLGFDERVCGFVYHNEAHIFANPGGTEARVYDLAGGNAVEITAKDFELIIGNEITVSENLEELERKLWAWAQAEGFFEM